MKRIKHILFVGVGVVMISLLTGCGEKQEMTAQEFKNRMEEKGYTVEEIDRSTTDYIYLEVAYTATNEDNFCQVQFYEMTDIEHALYFFSNNKEIWQELEDSSKEAAASGYANYDRYVVTTTNNYYVLSRVGKSVLYINSGRSCEDELSDVVSSLGY